VAIQMAAIEQYFPTVLFIMLHIVGSNFSMGKITYLLKLLNILSLGSINRVLQDGSNL